MAIGGATPGDADSDSDSDEEGDDTTTPRISLNAFDEASARGVATSGFSRPDLIDTGLLSWNSGLGMKLNNNHNKTPKPLLF
ncbi:hypothetical protein PIB30_025254 [Stylosanthes scabra]|uniref:Uncharacterized protein n=1 Tax=Stylosanthes scabra TaxID=79078 RepID=A0ABU6S9Q7_9FABA|nr:hypothetical protein [Stylosanthes scabra]